MDCNSYLPSGLILLAFIVCEVNLLPLLSAYDNLVVDSTTVLRSF